MAPCHHGPGPCRLATAVLSTGFSVLRVGALSASDRGTQAVYNPPNSSVDGIPPGKVSPLINPDRIGKPNDFIWGQARKYLDFDCSVPNHLH